MQSMTGYGNGVGQIPSLGKVSIEMRSSNHKFLEIVFHLPPGFISVEEKIKQEMESRMKRGRITCVIVFSGGEGPAVALNKNMIRTYLALTKSLQGEFGIKDSISMDALLHLPGVLIQDGNHSVKGEIWPRVRALIVRAIEDLLKTRVKEGKALDRFLGNRARMLASDLALVRARFKKACDQKVAQLKTDEERSVFLKNGDITEEMERLSFHIGNFQGKLRKNGPVGKELDFIAQEMQREVNTLAAKTFDTAISGRVVQMKSQIEKIREQALNVE